MTSNHKNSNSSLLTYLLLLSWTITILVGVWAWSEKSKYDRAKFILREYFDREIAKSKVLQLFEPNIHNRVLNNLFEEWLKNKNSNVLNSTIK
jgi:hypothetical protein